MAENVFAVTQSALNNRPRIDWVDGTALVSHQIAAPVDALHADADAQVSCGTPIAGVQLRITDHNGTLLPERHLGEIVIKSNFMLDAYYRRDDLRPLDSEGWYHTGDIGYVADGELFVAGRVKDLIINAGKNIFPQDIEAIVNTVPGIHPGRVVAFGVADEREGTELIAVVAETDTADPEDQRRIKRTIRAYVSQQSMVTVSYVELVRTRWLIKTSSGKIARAANREKWLQLHDGRRISKSGVGDQSQ
jgi:acyl-CoA synthetase (AMP-forming)/AMP-acid ligase II